jgi:hypothetical protein
VENQKPNTPQSDDKPKTEVEAASVVSETAASAV